jgi:hypothetical protein
MLHCTNKTWKNLVDGSEEWASIVDFAFLRFGPKNVGVTQTTKKTGV